MSTITVCKDCTDRHPACHDSCERYLAEKKEAEKKKTIYVFRKKIEQELDARQKDGINNMKRRHKKKW